MSEQVKRNWKIWGLAALLAIAAGGYVAKIMIEKSMVAEIEAAMADLPGGFKLKAETITVDALDNSVAMSKISGSGSVMGKTVTVSADAAEGRGVNPKAFREKGAATLADSLTIHNIKAGGEMIDSRIGLYHLEKVQADVAALNEQFAKFWVLANAEQKAVDSRDEAAARKARAGLMELLQSADLHSALETLRVGRGEARDYELKMTLPARPGAGGLSSLRLAMASAEGRDYSMTHAGPVACRGLKLDMNGAPLFSLDEISLQGMDFPSRKLILDMEKSNSRNPFANFEASLKDLRLRKLDVTLPGRQDGKIALAGLDLSLDMKKSSSAFAFKADQLDMPSNLLLNLYPMVSIVMDQLPRRLKMNSELDMATNAGAGNLSDVNIKKLDISLMELGDMALSVNVLDVDMTGRKSVAQKFAKVDLAVADKGFMKIVQTLYDAFGGGAAAGSSLADQVEAQRAMLPSQTLKDVNVNLTNFIRKPGGAMRLTVAPEKPVSLQEFQIMLMTAPDRLGISSSFTPGS